MSKGSLTVSVLTTFFFAFFVSYLPPALAQESRTGNEEIQRWIKTLESPDPKARIEAAKALGKREEQALPAVPALIRLLDGPSIERAYMYRAIRVTPATAAGGALREIGLAALPALTTALKDPSPALRLNVIWVLTSWPLDRTQNALLAATGDTAPSVRAAALNALWLTTDTRTIDVRIAGLKDPDPFVRIAAAASLRSPAVYPGQEAPRFTNDNRDRIARALLPFLSDQQMRTTVIYSLGTLGAEQAVDPILEYVNASDTSLRYVSINALAALQHPRATLPLIRLLSHEEESTVALAAQALGKIGDSRAVPLLCVLLKSSKTFLRILASQALSQIKDRTAVPALLAALEDNNDDARQSVATALGELKDDRAVPALIRLLEKRRPGRAAAATALGKIGHPQAVPILVYSLFQEDLIEPVQETAGDALEQIKSAEIVPLLAEAVLQKPAHRPGVVARSLIGRLVGEHGFDVNSEAFARWWAKNKVHYQPPSEKP